MLDAPPSYYDQYALIRLKMTKEPIAVAPLGEVYKFPEGVSVQECEIVILYVPPQGWDEETSEPVPLKQISKPTTRNCPYCEGIQVRQPVCCAESAGGFIAKWECEQYPQHIAYVRRKGES